MQELRKKKGKNAGSNNKLFSEGFLTIKELSPLNKRVDAAIDAVLVDLEENMDDFDRSKIPSDTTDWLMHVANFHMELDLHMLSQVNISRLKYLNFGGSFLRAHREVLALYLSKGLPERYAQCISLRTYDTRANMILSVAQFSERFCQLSLQKDVPIDVVAQHMLSCTELFAEWNKIDEEDQDPRYWLSLFRFMRSMTNYLHNMQLGEAWVCYSIVLKHCDSNI